jgi:hypothetical protein
VSRLFEKQLKESKSTFVMRALFDHANVNDTNRQFWLAEIATFCKGEYITMKPKFELKTLSMLNFRTPAKVFLKLPA